MIERLNPPALPRSTGYSHVVIVEKGRQAHISGQVALDAAGRLIGEGDLRAQTRQAFENLAAALAAAGATFRDVAKIVTYVVDLDAEKAGIVRAVRAGFFTGGADPASTMVGVTSLVDGDFLIEIEAIASVP